MTGIDWTYLVDEDLPPIDRGQVRPSVEAVAIASYTRTADISGALLGVFTDGTTPTYDQCQGVIDQAIELCLSDLPDYLPVDTYPRIQQAVVLKAACLVERFFYREQYEKGSARGHQDDYDLLIESIERFSGGGSDGERVDSIMARSTMAEYEPDYPMPPPRIMPRFPLPIDGSPDDEGQADN